MLPQYVRVLQRYGYFLAACDEPRGIITGGPHRSPISAVGYPSLLIVTGLHFYAYERCTGDQLYADSMGIDSIQKYLRLELMLLTLCRYLNLAEFQLRPMLIHLMFPHDDLFT